ncbi:hypothetical protein, partial [Armatimonas sp.]|uniref:hypothetical protein n=1 Tax=Armatimonas sp. TaxID=1872638 RepID=UPI00374DECB2
TSHGLRYRFLETLREFALARFAEQPEAEQLRWRRAHLAVFYDLLMTVPRRYDSEAAVRSEAVRPYQDNFVPALEFCRQDQPERALIFCWHLSTFWDWFAQSLLARKHLKLTLPLPECQTLDDDRRIALDELYHACTYTRDWEGAEYAANASDIATEHPKQYRLFMAEIRIDQGQLESAFAFLEQNLVEYRKERNHLFCSNILLRQSRVFIMQGRFTEAFGVFQQAEQMMEGLDLSLEWQSNHLRVKSLILRLQGGLAESRELLVRVTRLYTTNHSVAYNLINFASQALFEDKTKEAAQLYGASVAWCEHQGFDLLAYNYFSRERDLTRLRDLLGDVEFEVAYNLGYEGDPARILAQQLPGNCLMPSKIA